MYYKDDTHYFVMTAKKQSLLKKGVILQVRRAGSVPGILQLKALNVGCKLWMLV